MIRSGNGDLYREVPLNQSSRQAVADWLSERRPTGSGRCLSGLRAGGRRPDQSIWSCARSRPEPNSSSPRTRSGTPASRTSSAQATTSSWLRNSPATDGLRPHSATAFPRQQTGKLQRTRSRSRTDGDRLALNPAPIFPDPHPARPRRAPRRRRADHDQRDRAPLPLAHQHIHLYGHYPFNLATRPGPPTAQEPRRADFYDNAAEDAEPRLTLSVKIRTVTNFGSMASRAAACRRDRAPRAPRW